MSEDSFWRVYVEFAMDANGDNMERAIIHAAGASPSFSGGGMGNRDVGWHCDHELNARRIERALKAIGLSPVVREIQRGGDSDGR